MEINDIISHIMTKMTDTSELNHLKKVIKMRKEDIARDLKYTLRPGDKVKIDSRQVKEGTIEKIMIKNAVIRDLNGNGWTVPLTMIKTGE
tara:strand:- start:90 stop:359 length:270 start_codon:yes stop_codon:yes gene_type:complete